MLRVVAVEGYRTLRRLVLPLGPLTIVTGANGSGKSNFYRALRLIADTAGGGAVAAIAREGGLRSAMWAGPDVISRDGPREVDLHRPEDANRLLLGFAGDDFGYAIDYGMPAPDGLPTMFSLDAQIKVEAIWGGPLLRPASLLTQRGKPGTVLIRDDKDAWADSGRRLRMSDSVLSEVADSRSAPEVLQVREHIRSWRFYDGFRTDALAPARQPKMGTFTPVLDPEGADLASALQTIRELTLDTRLDAAVADAFPGSRVSVVDSAGIFSVVMHQRGLLRPLGAGELSDGTVRYLLWIAALLSERPPGLLVLNEPETSLHPDLLEPLARLIAAAARRTQLVVVTHSPVIRSSLEAEPDASHIDLVKDEGETRIAGQRTVGEPPWTWPTR